MLETNAHTKNVIQCQIENVGDTSSFLFFLLKQKSQETLESIMTPSSLCLSAIINNLYYQGSLLELLLLLLVLLKMK